jgi:hypothetical protein
MYLVPLGKQNKSTGNAVAHEEKSNPNELINDPFKLNFPQFSP